MSKLPHSHSYTTITEAIIALAHSLKLAVVAEGVENQAQYQFLRDHDCDFTQGFYLSKPITAAEMGALLKSKSLVNEF